MTTDPYAVANLMQRESETFAAYLERLGALYRAAPPTRRLRLDRGCVPITRADWRRIERRAS